MVRLAIAQPQSHALEYKGRCIACFVYPAQCGGTQHNVALPQQPVSRIPDILWRRHRFTPTERAAHDPDLIIKIPTQGQIQATGLKHEDRKSKRLNSSQ